MLPCRILTLYAARSLKHSTVLRVSIGPFKYIGTSGDVLIFHETTVGKVKRERI
jgi:hypothetical protein